MPTKAKHLTEHQVRNIHVAAGKSGVGMSKANYRMLLENVGDVGTSLDLTQAGYEDCMAVLEEMGYRQFLNGEICAPDYWRRKSTTRGTRANARQIHLIEELYRKVHESPGIPRYSIQGLTLRASESRTPDPRQLTPREAWNLIEMLKAILERATKPVATTENTENTEAAEADDMPF